LLLFVLLAQGLTLPAHWLSPLRGFVRPFHFVRTTRHSQILCQGQKQAKSPVFNDKISDFGKNRLKIADKISETDRLKPLFRTFAA